MTTLHLPWLEACMLLPLLGWAWMQVQKMPEQRWRHSILISIATLLCALGAWLDFGVLHSFEAHDSSFSLEHLVGLNWFTIDELSAPLLPLIAFQFLLIRLTTLRIKMARFPFGWAMLSESLLLATVSCKQPWVIVALLCLSPLLIYMELKERRKNPRIFVFHMANFVGFLLAGQAFASLSSSTPSLVAPSAICLAVAIMIRSGVFPAHCWMPDLFEKAGFGAALLFVTPMMGSYAAMRLLLQSAPDWVLTGVAVLSMFTAIYAAGMTFVQTEPRRFFSYLFISHSSLVLVGLEIATPLGLTGALCLWLSVGLSLCGFGLILRCVESRVGELHMQEFHGLFVKTPILAGFFLLAGLASIGFPGTVGFIALELLVEGAVEASPWVGVGVVIAAALNGLAVMQAYFHLFTGNKHASTVDLSCRMAERAAILLLSLLIVLGGLIPQPGVSSRRHAAMELSKIRKSNLAAQSQAMDGIARITEEKANDQPVPIEKNTTLHPGPEVKSVADE